MTKETMEGASIGERPAACTVPKRAPELTGAISSLAAPSPATATSVQDLDLDVDKLRDKVKSRIENFNADITAMVTKMGQQYAARAEKVHQEQAAMDKAHQAGKDLATLSHILDIHDYDPELAAKSAEAERDTDVLHQKVTAAHDEILKVQAKSEERVRSILTAVTEGMNKLKADLYDGESEMGRKVMEMSTATDYEGKVKAHKELMVLHDGAFKALQADFMRRTAYAFKDPQT